MDETIRLSVHESGPGKGVVYVDINNQATVQNLISAYCAKKGISYNSKIIVLDGKKNVLPQFRILQSLGIENGQTVYIDYEKKSTIMDRKWLFVLTIVVIASSVVAIIVMSSMYAALGGYIPFVYGIVLDAGSSKTNVLLYKWAGEKYNGTGCVQQRAACKAEGGIAEAEDVSYMLPCLNKVKGNIKSTSLSGTPVYFAATAGMRLLNLSDSAKTENKLDSVRTILSNTGMDLKAVEIITGKDEGQYAWITTNFLKDTLEKEQEMNPWHPTTIGAMDMGGASNQIAFALEPKNETDPGVEKIELYGQTHDVFSASFLCFGRAEAERRHRALLVKDPTNIKNITDPCSPTGHTYAVTGNNLFNQPCTQNKQFSNWLEQNPGLKNSSVTFNGSSDFAKCSEAMSVLTDYKSCTDAEFKECFQKINQPLKDQKFLAFATYYYTTSFLGVTKSTLDNYVNVTKNYCAKTKEQMPPKNKFATDYCFNACYIYEILINGYQFTEETWPSIEFLGEIDGKEIGWAFGLMIKASNMIPAKKLIPRITSVGVFAVCMIIFISLLIAAAVFLAYNFGRKKSHDFYQNA